MVKSLKHRNMELARALLEPQEKIKKLEKNASQYVVRNIKLLHELENLSWLADTIYRKMRIKILISIFLKLLDSSKPCAPNLQKSNKSEK